MHTGSTTSIVATSWAAGCNGRQAQQRTAFGVKTDAGHPDRLADLSLCCRLVDFHEPALTQTVSLRLLPTVASLSMRHAQTDLQGRYMMRRNDYGRAKTWSQELQP